MVTSVVLAIDSDLRSLRVTPIFDIHLQEVIDRNLVNFSPIFGMEYFRKRTY